MFKDIFKNANNEIKTPTDLKCITINKIFETSNKSTHKTFKTYNHKYLLPTSVSTIGITLVISIILSFNGTLLPYTNENAKEPWKNSTSIKDTPTTAYALGVPEYPMPIAFDDYAGKNSSHETLDEGYLQGVRDFSFNSAGEILNKSKSKAENSVYSPISLYMALTILAETTEGSTRGEILNLLSTNDMTLIASETPKLFRSLYTDNEIGKLNLANSLWLSNSYNFNQETIDKLTSNYYAHSFSVDFSNPETAKNKSEWISNQTGGKLGNDSSKFQGNPSEIMSIINTIYFYDQWQNEFDPSLTKADAFNLEDGTTVSTDFMNTITNGSFSRGENYTSASLNFKNDCSMVFVLPNEGTSTYDIIDNPTALSKAINYVGTPNEKNGLVTFKLPKFDFKNDLNLNDAVKALGVSKVFTFEADFSPLTNNNLFVSQVKQSATISIDEIGCEAAAFTEINVWGSRLSTDTADMILDRPFIFAIKDGNGIPLFIGVINNPQK